MKALVAAVMYNSFKENKHLKWTESTRRFYQACARSMHSSFLSEHASWERLIPTVLVSYLSSLALLSLEVWTGSGFLVFHAQLCPKWEAQACPQGLTQRHSRILFNSFENRPRPLLGYKPLFCIAYSCSVSLFKSSRLRFSFGVLG